MRVVAGTVGGRRLQAPRTPSGATRPTAEIVRGAVFNSLNSLGLVENTEVVDLFAGSGALGIEALSRGARSATFVERDRGVVAVLRANIASLGLLDQATVVTADAESWLSARPRRETPFDVALVDPPYAFTGWPSLLAGLAEVRVGLVVCESDRPIAGDPPWEILRVKRHGGSVVTLLQLRGAASL